MHAAAAGLAENRCLQRKQRGAKLLQIGEQEVAFGAKFKARVVLDIEVKPPPIAKRLYKRLQPFLH